MITENGGTGPNVSLIIPIKDIKDHFVIGVGRSLALIKWTEDDPDHHSVKPSVFISIDEDVSRNRLNDGKCDPQGRLWAGNIFYKI